MAGGTFLLFQWRGFSVVTFSIDSFRFQIRAHSSNSKSANTHEWGTYHYKIICSSKLYIIRQMYEYCIVSQFPEKKSLMNDQKEKNILAQLKSMQFEGKKQRERTSGKMLLQLLFSR